MAIDEARMTAFVNRFVGDLGATMAAGNIVVGDRLGLYRALAEGPQRPQTVAERTGSATVCRRVAARSGGRRLRRVRPGDGKLLAHRGAGLCVDQSRRAGLRSGSVPTGDRRAARRAGHRRAFGSGAGVGWHTHDEGVFTGCERFFRPGYSASLTSTWLPALDGVQAKLHDGGLIADIDCGHGASTLLMAAEYPRSTVLGSDYHAESVATARKRAAEEGLDDRVRFEVADAQTFTGGPFDLVTTLEPLIVEKVQR